MPRDFSSDSQAGLEKYYPGAVNGPSELSREKYVSGDGTWTASHVLVAVLGARNENVALAKASAAFSHREGRAEALFQQDRKETFELLDDLDIIPDCVGEAGWGDVPDCGVVDSETLAPLDMAFGESKASFDGEVISEWGKLINSRDSVNEIVDSAADDIWYVVGIALEPTGAGLNTEQYLGQTKSVACPACEHPRSRCDNIIYNERDDEHLGVWTCEQCSERFHGSHPEDVQEIAWRDLE